MSQPTPRVLAVVGCTHAPSSTGAVLTELGQRLISSGATVDLLDLALNPLPLFHPKQPVITPAHLELRTQVQQADVLLLGTPDYHGCMTGVLKNFLDHFWKEYAGKLFASVVASYDKGLTVTDQIRTVARQCYAWSLPYAVVFAEGTDVKDGAVIGEAFDARLTMMARDIVTYGQLLGNQRRADLASTEPCFMARFR